MVFAIIFGGLVGKLDVLAVECASSRIRRRRIGGSSGQCRGLNTAPKGRHALSTPALEGDASIQGMLCASPSPRLFVPASS